MSVLSPFLGTCMDHHKTYTHAIILSVSIQPSIAIFFSLLTNLITVKLERSRVSKCLMTNFRHQVEAIKLVWAPKSPPLNSHRIKNRKRKMSLLKDREHF